MKLALLHDAAAVLAGAATKPHLIFVAAVIALIWIGMDVWQFVSFLEDRFGASELPFPI
jgi:hypothetical protein